MIRAAAKNFIRVASVVDPATIPMVLTERQSTNGEQTAARPALRPGQKAFAHTAEYDRAIADYLAADAAAEIEEVVIQLNSGRGRSDCLEARIRDSRERSQSWPKI